MRRKFGRSANVAAPVIGWIIMVCLVFSAVQYLSAKGYDFDSMVDRFVQSPICSYLARFELALPLKDNAAKEEPAPKVKEKPSLKQPNIPAKLLFEQPEQKEEKQVPFNIFLDSDEVLCADTIRVDNKSGLDFDIDTLLNTPLDFTIGSGLPSVLIVHTHTSESFTKTASDDYEESDPYRTENCDYNVVRVGEELKNALESYGIGVIHDATIHDYPDYNGAYSRSMDTISENLQKYPSIRIVIDLHRDAIANPDGSQYKTVAQVEDKTCSQVLLVMGSSALVAHADWQKNLTLALKLQYAMNTLYPSLAKPILLSQYKYNQDATTGSMILEVGCAGNTLDESLCAVRYFADAAAQVFLSVKNN